MISGPSSSSSLSSPLLLGLLLLVGLLVLGLLVLGELLSGELVSVGTILIELMGVLAAVSLGLPMGTIVSNILPTVSSPSVASPSADLSESPLECLPLFLGSSQSEHSASLSSPGCSSEASPVSTESSFPPHPNFSSTPALKLSRA
jgi:hypothetical protein